MIMKRSIRIEDHSVYLMKRSRHNSYRKPPRCVKFSDSIKIELIPTSAEYADWGLSLWWTHEDISQFKKAYYDEKYELLTAEIRSSILIVTDSPVRKKKLAARLSTIVSKDTKFKSCTHEQVERVLTKLRQGFAAIVVDGTPEGCVVCPYSSPGDTAQFVRSQVSKDITVTLLVQDNGMASTSLMQQAAFLWSEITVLSSDCWKEYVNIFKGF
mmetsp:Transcript_3551/g.5533  ORF Transcript_3551/g.5533 Transcript_3551/m.5533 type:complete len:213 (-) Transcript_3551:198-836(-)